MKYNYSYADDTNFCIEMIEFLPYETGYVQSYLKILNDYIKTFNNTSNLSVRIYVINKLYQFTFQIIIINIILYVCIL